MSEFPIVLTQAGLQPQSPTALRDQLLALATAASPGLTANLPGTLIEDIASTDVGALTVIDSAKVELVNSLTPFGANMFLLNQLGVNVYGVPMGTTSNTSVYCVFAGAPGLLIAQGFLVSDGTHQYRAVTGGIIGSSGFTSPLFFIAVQPGIWAVAPNTVTILITSIPGGFVVTVDNPQPGTPGGEAETPESYRALVLQAGAATAVGMPATLKKLLNNVAGVQARLVSMIQQTGGGWSVLVGGGDPYEVANAIYTALFDISTLVGSAIDPGRDVTVTITDYPDLYAVTFINPPAQTVGISLLWNTTATNFIVDSAIAQLGAPALVNYINALFAGQPINIFEMEDAFKEAVSSAIEPSLISRMVFSVLINGVGTPPVAGTGIINGDPEGFFFTELPSISIARG